MLSIWIPVMFLVFAMVAVMAGFMIKNLKPWLLIAGGFLGSAAMTFVLACVATVPPGHAGVTVLFGDVSPDVRAPGIHMANPLLDWTYYDCRQKTHKESMEVPSRDQLLTGMDVSIQYRMKASMMPTVLSETGTIDDVIAVHMQPTVRSVLREQGKTIDRAEDFFTDKVQNQIQAILADALVGKLATKGMVIQEVLIRDIRLPGTIRKGVEEKKQREQEAEKQKAELRRFETEQQQLVATANAELDASRKAAEQKKVLADAQAYEIRKINEAIASNPAYIQLEALKALQSISKDPNAKIYFLNGDSPQPLPLMHMGMTPAATATTKKVIANK